MNGDDHTSGQQEPLLVGSESSSTSVGGGNEVIARTAEIGDRDGDGDVFSAPGKLRGESAGLFIWMLTFSAGISGLLFGCK